MTRETEICEDIQEECSKYGEVMDMKIPRPSGGSRQSAGIGKVRSVWCLNPVRSLAN